jgi:hypothetical protein
MKIELTNKPLFEVLLDFDVNGVVIDLHNDYSCVEVILSNETPSSIILKFVSNKNLFYNNILLVFLNYEIINYIPTWETNEIRGASQIFDINKYTEYDGLDNLSRCRFVDKNNSLIEVDRDDRKCFILEFTSEQLFEILASMVFLEVS